MSTRYNQTRDPHRRRISSTPIPPVPPRPSPAEAAARYAQTHADVLRRLDRDRADAAARIKARDPNAQANIGQPANGGATGHFLNGWVDPAKADR